MSYTYVVSESSVSLFNLTNGNKVTMYSDDARYEKFKELIIAGDFRAAENMDAKSVIQKFSKSYVGSTIFSVDVIDGIGSVSLFGNKYPLADAITNRIIKMESEGFSAEPLVNFLKNLYGNPSKTAIDELFLFLEATDLPITTDGCFIAYKIVKDNYMDIYTGAMDNSVGKTVEMPRFSVDDKRQNLCSAGLHFCSKGYLSAYGSSNQSSDRCVLVKINPSDVVSIPADYNNAKGRTCRYVVVGEMEDKEWRTVLSQRDYNARSVVDEYANDFDFSDFDEDEDDQVFSVFHKFFYVDSDNTVHWGDSQRPAEDWHIVNKLIRYANLSKDDAWDWVDRFESSLEE